MPDPVPSLFYLMDMDGTFPTLISHTHLLPVEDDRMIRERIRSATIQAISYDQVTSAVIVEFTAGKRSRHAPVPYSVYHAIASSRFPEKTYRHLIADRVLPAADRDN